VKVAYRASAGTDTTENIMFQDIRFGFRMLFKAPAFTLVAVLALGLGIGVNTSILSAVNGFVLRPLPVEKPEELRTIHWGKKSDASVWGKFSYLNYQDVRDGNTSFSGLSAWLNTSAGISSTPKGNAGPEDRPELAWGELVSSNYFDVMGVKPALGRTFLPEEGRTEGDAPIVVISHFLWQKRFSGDPAIIGKTVFMNGNAFSVVGVMPESFTGSTFYLRVNFWAPLTMSRSFGQKKDWMAERGLDRVNLFGRLKPGVSVQTAEADLNRLSADLATRFPRENESTKMQLTTEVEGRYDEETKLIAYGGWLAVCISGLVLLLACANVANLMLARATTRAREIGIRVAIGAGRGRIIRQLLVESVLLAFVGGGLGWLFAYFGADVIKATIPPVPYPLNLDFKPDLTVLKWMFGISFCTGVLFGLAPAILASRANLVSVIKGMSGGATHHRTGISPSGLLVVAQVAISIVVLVCAGLFVRSLGNVRNTDPGFKTDHLVTMMLDLDLAAYDRAASTRFFREVQRRVETQPGVRSTALASELPLMVSRASRGPVVKEGESDPPPNQGLKVECSFVTPRYFETLQTQLLVGREFTERDDETTPPVVIVNQEFARRFFGDERNAVGKRFRFQQGTPLMEIVAVAKTGKYGTLYEDPTPYLFLPVAQYPRSDMTLMVSVTSADAIGPVIENVRREINRIDPRLPVYGVLMAEDNLSLAYWGPRVAAGMATTFGLLGLLLATMGLYSVMTYAVTQRTREIGIRMAIGANLGNVLGLIIRQGMRMVAIGLGVGLIVAFGLTRVLSSLLLGVGASDPLTFGGVAALLIGIALLACWLPARRATKVDPMVALRWE
jgi:predicted permease